MEGPRMDTDAHGKTKRFLVCVHLRSTAAQNQSADPSHHPAPTCPPGRSNDDGQGRYRRQDESSACHPGSRPRAKQTGYERNHISARPRNRWTLDLSAPWRRFRHPHGSMLPTNSSEDARICSRSGNQVPRGRQGFTDVPAHSCSGRITRYPDIGPLGVEFDACRATCRSAPDDDSRPRSVEIFDCPPFSHARLLEGRLRTTKAKPRRQS